MSRASTATTVSEQTERLVGFSDALFAIALTFLALELGGEIPEDLAGSGSEGTLHFLAEHSRDSLVYFGLFLIVGFFWLRHHRSFRFIHRTSTTVMWINWVLLSLVALLPYPASLVARSIGAGQPSLCCSGCFSLLRFCSWLSGRSRGCRV